MPYLQHSCTKVVEHLQPVATMHTTEATESTTIALRLIVCYYVSMYQATGIKLRNHWEQWQRHINRNGIVRRESFLRGDSFRLGLRDIFVPFIYRQVAPKLFILKYFKLQPAIFPLCNRVIRFHELPAETIQCFSQYGLYIIDSLHSIEHCLKEPSS